MLLSLFHRLRSTSSPLSPYGTPRSLKWEETLADVVATIIAVNQVAEAKKRVEAKSAIPPLQQRLIFAGKAM